MKVLLAGDGAVTRSHVRRGMLASLHGDDSDIAAPLRAADKALSRANVARRNRVVVAGLPAGTVA